MKKGFTLIEILIVVAIISILASVVIIGLGTAQKSGRDARRAADLSQVRTALALYYQKCGFYPGPPEAAGNTCTAPFAAVNYSGMRSSIIGSSLGISTLPNSDPSGNPYTYATDAAGQVYVLGIKLDDPNSNLLKESLHGTQQGINCDAPVYCIGPS